MKEESTMYVVLLIPESDEPRMTEPFATMVYLSYEHASMVAQNMATAYGNDAVVYSIAELNLYSPRTMTDA